jgi:hypothetical protein
VGAALVLDASLAGYFADDRALNYGTHQGAFHCGSNALHVGFIGSGKDLANCGYRKPDHVCHWLLPGAFARAPKDF